MVRLGYIFFVHGRWDSDLSVHRAEMRGLIFYFARVITVCGLWKSLSATHVLTNGAKCGCRGHKTVHYRIKRSSLWSSPLITRARYFYWILCSAYHPHRSGCRFTSDSCPLVTPPRSRFFGLTLAHTMVPHSINLLHLINAQRV